MQAGPAPVLEGTSEEWSGEAYEEDKAGAFLKYCAQVQHVPQQCVRYRYVSQSMQTQTCSVSGCL